jgi:CheY-like chemotaxis protein
MESNLQVKAGAGNLRISSMGEEAAVRREVAPMNLLIVDDELAIRETCSVVAEQCGMRATGVATAEEALEVLEHSAVDILLTDLKLPQANGVARPGGLRKDQLQRFGLEAEKIRVEVEMDPALPAVHGDSGQLQQVLMNLVGNSRQAIEQLGRSGTIHVRTKKIGEQKMLMEVRDDGPGVPPAILARIFDPFFTTKPPGVGTGLGLAIVLSVVREHGGQVRFLNPPEGGAVFQIELPAADRHSREEGSKFSQQERRSMPHANPRSTEREERLASRRPNGKVNRVLVVEDEPTVARLIARRAGGRRIRGGRPAGRAGSAGARGARSVQPGDLRHEDAGTGWAAFLQVFGARGNPLHERFLFVTGDTVAAQTQEFLRHNDLPHVAKPFRVEELAEKVHRVLESKVRREVPVAVKRKHVARNG